MKKLIERLQKHLDSLTIPNDRFGKGWKTGYVQALQIVKSYDPWIDVSEELPPPYEQEPGRSIEILILTEDGNIYTGVYVYEQRAFFILNRRSIAKEIKWTYLPEVKR